MLNNSLIKKKFFWIFQVIHSLLIFDILRKLIESFAEKDIELILLVLRSKYGFHRIVSVPGHIQMLCKGCMPEKVVNYIYNPFVW